MLNLFTPILYNSDLRALFACYSGFYAPSYSPFTSLFSPAMNYYGSMGMVYPYINNNYGYYNSYSYPNIFAYNYSLPVGFYGGCSALPVQTAAKDTVPTVQTPKVDSNVVTDPVKPVSSASQKVEFYAQTTSSPIGTEFVNVAQKYSNCSEKDGSHLKFCINPTCMYEDPKNEEWCTDFVTYVVKEAYQNQGKTAPEGFGTHDVKTMKNWAINNGCFIRTTNKSKKAQFIAEIIKPGDIMIINENGASHTGFVMKVDSDGIIHTIEGNRDDKVKEYQYSPNYPDLSGFIRLAS